MILDIAPGAIVHIDGHRYTVEEHAAYHEIDFRLDVVRIVGATPAHERWLVAAQPQPYLMLMQRLEQEWMAPPTTSIAHDGEIFAKLYRGAAHLVRRGRHGRAKEGRTDYALFRGDSGRVILTLGRDDELLAWIGMTLPQEAVRLP